MKVRNPLYSCAMVAAAVPVGYIQQDGFAQRLRHAVALFGGPTALARRIGRSEGAIRKWLRGESEPNVTDLRAICAACGTKAEWLVNGAGESGLIPEGVSEPPAIYDARPAMDDALLERIMITVDELEAQSETKIAINSIAINRKATLITALYALCRAQGTVDRDAVSRLISSRLRFIR
jgi:transcriptional regulator with XRE-family HTH domain